MSAGSGRSETSPKPTLMYDDNIDVPETEEVHTPPPPSGSGRSSNTRQLVAGHTSTASTSNHRALVAVGRGNSEDSSAAPDLRMLKGAGGSKTLRHQSHHSSSDDDDEDDDSDEEPHAEPIEGAYDPAEFEHLSVAPEVKELFTYITRYTPQTVDLEYRLRPFVPDFIPAVGDIDAFLKIPTPDNKDDGCGLKFLDEPSGKQSDPAVLDLQLRALAKQSSARVAVVKRVEHAERNSKAVDKWIRDISDLHRSRPPPAVHYTRQMPEVDSLMQEWPTEVEQRLQEIGVPTPDLECDLASYVDIICGLFDIPVFESRIQSLHLLFTLHTAVRNSKYNPANTSDFFS